VTLLRARDVSVSFGGVHAVDNVDLTIAEGCLVGCIGPNGAGKTTLVDALTGFVTSTGRVEINGRDLSKSAPHERARAGLVRTWQSIELFDDLTVWENTRVAAATDSDAEFALSLLDLFDLRENVPAELSYGVRKLVGIARALAARPQVCCLDEPAAGLDSNESAALGVRLRHIIDAGTALLLVDHDMGLVMNVCDEIYVIESGSVIAHGAPAEIACDERVVAAYLGEGARP
jgi:branched-chain amino acid transport system ATP-binding protein